VKLHLGCFDRPADGWVNTDITPHITIARIPGAATILYRLGVINATRFRQHREGVFARVRRMDVGKRFPFEDACADAVFASHLLEHMPLDVAANCLREIYRVLKPGGIVRLGVPDLDLLVRRFDPHAPDEFVAQIFESRHSRDKNRHHWMYNETSLAAALRRTGFVDPVRRTYGVGECPDIASLDNRPEITLFMEARTPGRSTEEASTVRAMSSRSSS